jgi:hypothetical protein
MDDEEKEKRAAQHLLMAQVAAKSLGPVGRARADRVGKFLVSGSGTHLDKVNNEREASDKSHTP